MSASTEGRWFPCPNKECGISLNIARFDVDTQCKECKTIFRYLECPYLDCNQTLLYNRNEFVPGKRYKCVKCKRGFQKIVCPHCQDKITFTNRTYVEGTTVTCTSCSKSFQQVSCAHCRKCITYPSCNYRQGTLVSCPYQGCGKRFQHVVCPHCTQNVVFSKCNFRHGLKQTCPYKQVCGKPFQMINCSHCQQSIFFPKCDYVEGKVHTCPLQNCKKDFQMILCGHCQGSIFFKRCDYKLGNRTRCPYPHCQKEFQQVSCPHCTSSIVFKSSNYRESKSMKCPYQYCSQIFQHMNCPHCAKPMVWRKGDYYEGEYVKCCYKGCGKLYQHINCPHCSSTIIWKDANKNEKQLQQCPYSHCKKKFYHFNCQHCRKPVVVQDWKKFLPGSQLKCPYANCQKIFSPSTSPSHLLDKVPKNTIFFPTNDSQDGDIGEGSGWTFDQFITHRDEPFSFMSDGKPENSFLLPVKEVVQKLDGRTGHPIILGTGSFGKVFPAQLRGHSVIVKEIMVGGSLGNEDIEKEIKEVRSLKHPNLMTPLGYCKPSDNVVWIVMMNSLQFNSSLRDLCLKDQQQHDDDEEEEEGEEESKLSWFEKWFLLRKMTESLQALHRNEIVHRDLKLTNFLLSKNLRIMKLSDFGLSKIKSSARRETSGRLRPWAGSLAPELLTPNPRSTLYSDIYALGMSFYTVVVGRPPYDVGEAQTMMMVKMGTLPDIPKEVPRLFGELIKWCWVRDPTERPTCEDILTFLKDNELMFIAENCCKSEKLSLPLIFTCPITLKIMEDPYVLKETGEAFEKEVIDGWLKTNDEDPMTGKVLKEKTCVPDVSLRSGIDSWKKCSEK